MKMRSVLVCFFITVLIGFTRADVVFYEDVVSETYASYTGDNLGESMGITFDGSGNLYVTQRGTASSSYNNGSIYRITPDGQATRWVDGINGPRRIEWTGGSSYGENLYVVTNPREIYSISLEGVVNHFSSISTGPHAITLDRAGNNYGGFLYSATRGTDQIYSISNNGSTSVFSPFPGTISGGPIDIAFGNANYGDMMYIAVADGSVGGIYQINANGDSLGLFNDVTLWASDIEFDTSGRYFGQQLYVMGYGNIWRIDSEGDEELFATGFSPNAVFTFDQDGAMYIAELQDDVVTITRVVPSRCSYKGALEFDGVDDYVRIFRSESLEPEQITIEAWVYLDGAQRYHGKILRKSGNFDNGYLLSTSQASDRRMQLRINYPNTVIVADPQDYELYFYNWHHFAGAYDSEQAIFYVDGIRVNSVTHSTGPLLTSPVDLIIGSGVSNGSEAFKGQIDEVRIWNYPRTEEQIQENMFKALKGDENGLVGYWNFDEGEGQVVYDLSEYANHGVLGSDGEQEDSSDPVRVVSGICLQYEEDPSGELAYHVNVDIGNDEANNGKSRFTPFATINKAIEVAEDGNVVLVYPGVYEESVDFLGKAITVRSVHDAAILNGGLSIELSGDEALSGALGSSTNGFVFASGEGNGSVLENFIVRNFFTGIYCEGSYPVIRNITIVNNRYGVIGLEDAMPNINSCIFWNNSIADLFECSAEYSCVQSEGEGNIQQNPIFADAENGDYHLMSRMGSYVPEDSSWIIDSETSPCIDTGDPTINPLVEPMPNGGRINMGAYGGTASASKSINPWPIAADLNFDGIVDLVDFSIMAQNWLWQAPWYE